MKRATRTLAARASLAIAAAALAAVPVFGTPHAVADTAQVPGMDVSGYQGNVDWRAAWAAGARFAYIKATEGTNYRNPYFAQQYNGAYDVGMIRGAYHFARPDVSDGRTQADFFVAHGGAWSADGKTLPPMLDIEYNPSGQTCFGLSQAAMTGWIKAFSDDVHTRTGRWPMLYTTTDWWKTCTGNSAEFGDTHPLFIARYASSAGPLPNGWRYYTMWQYSDSGNKPGDQDSFNGSMEQLNRLAGGDAARTVVAPPPVTTTPATTTPPPTHTSPSSSSPKPSPTTSTPSSSTPSSSTPPTSTPPTSSSSATPSSPTSTSARREPALPVTTTPSSSTVPTSQAPAPSHAQAGNAEPISGLVWAGPQNANPPQSLRANNDADELRARSDAADQSAPHAAVATPQQAPVTAAPAETATRSLASTGTNAVRIGIFGAALLLLGTILIFLTRIVLRR